MAPVAQQIERPFPEPLLFLELAFSHRAGKHEMLISCLKYIDVTINHLNHKKKKKIQVQKVE